MAVRSRSHTSENIKSGSQQIRNETQCVDDRRNTSLTYNKTLRLKAMTFQSNIGTSLLPDRAPARVTLDVFRQAEQHVSS